MIKGQVADLISRTNQEHIGFATSWFGYVAAAKTETGDWIPTDLNDPLYVIIPDFDDKHVWGPCRWQSRDSTSLPLRGDSCMVTFDNRRNLWIPCWWPAEFETKELG